MTGRSARVATYCAERRVGRERRDTVPWALLSLSPSLLSQRRVSSAHHTRRLLGSNGGEDSGRAAGEQTTRTSSNSDRQSAINATMESLERSLNNISIDEGPWRQHDQPPVWGSTQQPQQPRGVWAPPFQTRSPWQQESSDIEQNVNEALGLTGTTSTQSQWGPIQSTDYDNKQIWADPHSDVQYPPPPHAPFGSLNGIGGAPTDWSLGSQSNHGVWGNSGMNKETDDFWKQQQTQQHQQQFPMPLLQGAWAPRGHGPAGQGQRGGHMMNQDFQSGWGGQNNMGGNKPMNRPWGDNNRGMSGGMSSRNGRPNQNSRYSSMNGVDVSVPPPMEMHMGGGMGMRNMGSNGGHGGWSKGGNGGNQSGGHRGYGRNSSMSQNSNHGGNSMWGGNGGNSSNMSYMSDTSYNSSTFTIGGASDDLTLSVWHDPNGELKKWQRDTGVSYWGDPEKQTDRTISLWLVAEGADEDLETALNRCPVPQKKTDENQRFPFPVPPKRPIVVTGWGELPENDPNNPAKSEGVFDENRWNDVTTETNPWYLPNRSSTFTSDNTTGSWVQGGTIPLNEPGPDAIVVADMLKNAVDKGYLDQSVTQLANLPPLVLQHVNLLLDKIPALDSVENELKAIVEGSRPDDATEIDPQNPQKYMNDSQKLEHNRLIIEVTTAKIEVQDYSKKINRALIDAGIVQPQEQRPQASSEDYHYSFLE